MIATGTRSRPSRAFPRRIEHVSPATIAGGAQSGAAQSGAAPARVSGAMPGLAGMLNEWAQYHAVSAADGVASISGGNARTPQPQAMMARGARVTGSGAGAPPAQPPPAWPQTGAALLASGSQVVFSGLEALAVEAFL